MFVLRQESVAFDRATIAPDQLSFVLCIEGNGIEHQALLLCESIRRFGGRYSGSPIIAVSPREDVPISAHSRERLRAMDVEHVSLPLNRTGSAYLTINRIVAGAWAERHLSTAYIVVLDSDTLFTAEPAFFCCDAGARPVDAKSSTSAGPADPKDPYWQRICELAGIGIEQLPWIDTTIDNFRIRASFNGGFAVVSRLCGILQKTEEVFLASLLADLRPQRGEGINVFASTGYVGREASELWGSSQAALSAAIAAQASELLIYDERYNIPLHLLKPDSCNRVAWPDCEPILLHHHWLTRSEHRSSLLGAMRCFRISEAWLRWLSERLDLLPKLACPPPSSSAPRRSKVSATTSTEEVVARVAASTGAGRGDIWSQIIQQAQAQDFLELGVLRGAFAEHILRHCPGIMHYYMLDPWRHLDDWNKPANVDQPSFDEIYSLAMSRTAFARERRIVLRGRTTEMIDEISDESLDIAYIDGDHTLRGIAIDLILTYPKIRPGGILGGDDYTATIWQHADNFEPSLVCPFAAYFAESRGAPIVILPHSQFAIVKPSKPGRHFRVIDTTQSYGPRSLLPQITKRI